jgi:serine/threonine protein kinase
MKGGLLLNNEVKNIKTIQDAVNVFKTKEYATFHLLTNSSIACITFKATLKPGVISPFIEIRSSIFGKPVRSLLFKYFPIKNPALRDDYDKQIFTTPFNRGRENVIEIADESEIINEYLLQLKIYQQTYNTISSAYEPVCPYPIHYETNLSKNNTIEEIIKLLEEASNKQDIANEIKETLAYESYMDSEDELERREVIFKLGYVVMEFMEDYVPFSSIYQKISSAEQIKIKSLIAYEFARLHSIGIIHGDLHLSNIMYNPKYKYITDGSNRKDLGRVLLIDFGRSTDKMESQIEALNQKIQENYSEDAIGEISKYENSIFGNVYKSSLFKFKPPYTFEYIYTKRLELTLKFRKTIINKTMTDINKFIRKHPSKIAIHDLEKFKKSNAFKLATAVLEIKPLYPQNFSARNNVFNFHEFNEPFNKRKQDIFNAFNITKRLKIDNAKKNIPIEFYPDVELTKELELPKIDSMSKVKKTKYLEKISQVALNTVGNLNNMVSKMFTGKRKDAIVMFTRKNKKVVIGGSDGDKNPYHSLRYHSLAQELQKNIRRKIKTNTLKLQKRQKH